MIVGIRNVVGFGTLVLLGLGGTMVELIRDTVVRMGPVTRSEAMEMLDESRAGELMKGFRGRGPLDRDAVAAAVAGLSRFGVAASELVAAAELNPLIVGLSGCGAWAVDAVIEKTMGTAAHK